MQEISMCILNVNHKSKMPHDKIIRFSTKFPQWKSSKGSENLVHIRVPNKNSEMFTEKTVEGNAQKG